LDNTCHPDARIEKHRAGDLYDMITVKYETVKPAGEWNKVRIRVKNGHLEEWLNGRKVIETDMWDANWNEMIKKSKFKDMKGFGQSKKGRISLQDHGNPVWFKNLRIRKL
jgi:cytochrome c